VKAGARTGTPVRADTGMFAEPVRCTLLVDDAPAMKVTHNQACDAFLAALKKAGASDLLIGKASELFIRELDALNS
jgi:hypothetical protein